MRIGIAATVKDEAPYLVEWIAFHRAVGIETFFIADNGGNDDTSELLKRLESAGYITRFNFIGQTAPQKTAYDMIVPRMRAAVDLVAIIDADEFIRPVEEARADIAFSRYFENPNVSAIAINWACYGSSNHLRHIEGLVLERFTMRSKQTFDKNKHVKSVIRVDRYLSYCNPHVFNIRGGRYIDTSGDEVKWDPQFGPGASARCLWDKIRIDHFIVKSLEEFETIKRSRGRGDCPPGHPLFMRDRQFFDDHNRNDVCDPMTANFVDETKNEIQRMRSRLKGISGIIQNEKSETDSIQSIRRNQPCPCGSGRKYKHCHGAFL
jgi:hypothetical protein